MKKGKRHASDAFILFVSIVFALVIAEIFLRLAGHMPETKIKFSNEKTMHQYDAALGWKNKQGNYETPAYTDSGQPIKTTFLPSGARITGHNTDSTNNALVIVGGSYTQGWAISDSETFAWKLQARHPSLYVLNYGTGGYGSLQSLMVIENELPRIASPSVVLYGFIEHHEIRNVAPYSWMIALSRASERGHVFVPYATYKDDKGLVRHKPERFLSLPYSDSFSIIALIEKVYMKVATRNRAPQKRKVTEQLLLDMNTTTSQHGAKFVVVLLELSDEAKLHYKNYLTANMIEYIDCAFPLTPDMEVAGEGHPNGEMNTRWAECISSNLGNDAGLQG
jgi:hypothetical protein